MRVNAKKVEIPRDGTQENYSDKGLVNDLLGFAHNSWNHMRNEGNTEQEINTALKALDNIIGSIQYSKSVSKAFAEPAIELINLSRSALLNFKANGSLQYNYKDSRQPSNPNQGMPNQGMPNQGMPGQGMPGQGMPGQGMPGQGMPGQGMPNQDEYNEQHGYYGPGGKKRHEARELAIGKEINRLIKLARKCDESGDYRTADLLDIKTNKLIRSAINWSAVPGFALQLANHVGVHGLLPWMGLGAARDLKDGFTGEMIAKHLYDTMRSMQANMKKAFTNDKFHDMVIGPLIAARNILIKAKQSPDAVADEELLQKYAPHKEVFMQYLDYGKEHGYEPMIMELKKNTPEQERLDAVRVMNMYWYKHGVIQRTVDKYGNHQPKPTNYYR
jgi:hypothetical protein